MAEKGISIRQKPLNFEPRKETESTLAGNIYCKFHGKLVRPFQDYFDSLIIAGRLQKFCFDGIFIQLVEDTKMRGPIFHLHLGTSEEKFHDCSEEIDQQNTLFLLKNDDYFWIEIVARPESYGIIVNNGMRHSIDRKDPSKQGDILKIGGSIAFLTQIHHRSSNQLPPAMSLSEMKNPNRFLCNFPIAMHEGRVLVLTMLPYGNPDGHVAIFFVKNSLKAVALRLKINFQPPESINLVAANDEGELEKEYFRDEMLPIKINKKFRLALGATSDRFLIAINGFVLPPFHYRSSNKDINGLHVTASENIRPIVRSVDHIDTKRPDCKGFEEFSSIEIGLV